MMFLLLLVVTLALGLQCDKHDAHTYRQQGHTFDHHFRALGGLFVSRSAFEAGVRRISGLSEACSECYGKMYSCGWDHCE